MASTALPSSMTDLDAHASSTPKTPETSGTGAGDMGGKGTGNSTPPIPKCHLRVLVISGQSHTFSFEPELTVGRVKEIIWSSWPSDWASPTAPPSPAYLRLLHSGRMLQDDTTLATNGLPTSLTPTSPSVVHISIRTFSLHEDGDPKKHGLVPTLSRRSSRRRNAAPQEDVSGCKCIIM